jgi:hypothetical protein
MLKYSPDFTVSARSLRAKAWMQCHKFNPSRAKKKKKEL